MPTTFIASGNFTYSLPGGAGFTSYMLLPGNSRTVSNGEGIGHTSAQTSAMNLTVLGDVLADEQGIRISRNGNTEVSIGAESYVAGATSTGVSMTMNGANSNAYFTNLGTVTGDSVGASIYARAVEFANHGTIAGMSAAGVNLSASGDVNGNDISFANTGLISGNSYGMSASIIESGEGYVFNAGSIISNGINGLYDVAMDLGARGDFTVVNTGEIAGPMGIVRDFIYNVEGGPEINNLNVHNSGTIAATSEGDRIAVGFSAFGSDTMPGEGPYGNEWIDPSWSALDLTNTNLIVGNVVGAERRDTIINTGIIDGNVVLNGGNDIFDGRGGEVLGYVAGGAGNDIYRVDDGDIVLLETEDMGLDSVESSVAFELGSNIERLRLLGGDNINGSGNELANRLTGNMGANRLDGEDEDDFIYGRGGADTLLGGNGDDFLSGNSGWDTLRGGMGDDTLLGGAGRNRLDGGEGEDRASYSNAQMTGVRADLEDAGTNTGIARGDTYTSIENLWGTDFDDRLYGDAGNNEIIGDMGDDTIWGRDGDDYVSGWQGNDRISGNLGNDTLRGGSGNDTFNFWTGNGNDVIEDYTDGSDMIRFFIGGLNYAGLTISNVAGNAVIDYGTGQITLDGVNSAVLDAGDFMF